MSRTWLLAVVLMSVLAIPGAGIACVSGWLPDFDLSTATVAYGGQEYLSCMILPDGSGDTLDQARLPDGTLASAVITLQLLDSVGVPYADYCRADMALDAISGGLAFCADGNLADSNTDANGVARFHGPLAGGGHSPGLLQVLVKATALTSAAGFRIRINSPDIDGDLQVDLTDVVLFTGDFFGPYEYRSDFHRDGVINLSDVARMATSLGAGCR